MKKLLVMFVVLGMASMASAAVTVDVHVNGQQWDGSSSVSPSDIVSVWYFESANPFSGGFTGFNLNVSDGDYVADSLGVLGGALFGGLNATDATNGFDIGGAASYFNADTAGGIVHFEFHVPNLPDSSVILIRQTAGTWGGGDFPSTDIHVTPEPVTMSMLGLGGLALLRRRRA
jgi:hypothetical protein